MLADAVATRQATSDYDVPPDLVVEGSADLLELALTNLAENAVEHNDSTTPHVEICADHDPDQPYPLTISVIDNGPGIPDNEQRIIEKGSETSLQHGTGLGLWVIRWAVTNAGGELDFESRSPRGTIISLQLPRAFQDDTQATAASASVRR